MQGGGAVKDRGLAACMSVWGQMVLKSGQK